MRADALLTWEYEAVLMSDDPREEVHPYGR